MIQTRILMLDETRGVVLAFQSFGGQVSRHRRMIPERLATPCRRGHMVLADTLLVSKEPRPEPRRSAGVLRKSSRDRFAAPGTVQRRQARLQRWGDVGGQACVAGTASVRYTPGAGAAHHARNKRGG